MGVGGAETMKGLSGVGEQFKYTGGMVKGYLDPPWGRGGLPCPSLLQGWSRFGQAALILLWGGAKAWAVP